MNMDTITQPPCEYSGVHIPSFSIEPEQMYNYTSQLFEWHLEEKIEKIYGESRSHLPRRNVLFRLLFADQVRRYSCIFKAIMSEFW